MSSPSSPTCWERPATRTQLDGYTAQWDINGETTTFGVKKL